MQIIKFTGKDRIDGTKRAVAFFYDNYVDQMKLDIFLAKCRVQSDGATIHFYPNLEIDLEEVAKRKRQKRKERRYKK